MSVVAPPVLVHSELVHELARTAPDSPAVIEVGERPTALTWGELQDAADRVSALLLDLGVRPGESVAFQLPNWIECVTTTLGVLQIGAVVAPIMPVFGPREVSMVLSRSRARVLFVPQSFRKRPHAAELAQVAIEADARGLPLAVEHVVVVADADREGTPRAGTAGDGPFTPPAAPAVPITDDEPGRERRPGSASGWTWHDFDDALASVSVDRSALEARRPGPDDVAQLLFTSGTTGEPKGVQHAHRSLGLATAMHVAQTGLGADDRVYIPSPLAHQTGFLYGLLLSWRLGVPSVVQPIWDARTALSQAFGTARATFVQAATPFLMDLVEAVEGGEPAPESLRIVVPTGAAVPRELAERAMRVLGTVTLGAFGTTETCLGALASPGDGPAAWGSDGRALEGVGIRIVDDEGVELPRGAEGNYELSSPTMFLGYLDRPDLTAEVFTADGWYRTGDLAILDEAGFLHITGRVKDVINRGGEKVPVVEIENLLFQHPRVKDVAIVAEPHPRLGERACAFVVTADGAEPLGFGEMQEYLAAAKVSKYFWPERLAFVDELPRNPVGKVQKNLLRVRAAELVADGGGLTSTRA
ncbi:hypothetical protein GCM10010988_10410 [Cnuibacter physcomitrellae]|uniref:AMP-binding protein n=1 Tax=Cnuibacter physcomitrellae TaxID=1619308 RepID=UPI001984544E|nr:AMP-binding protein [Cnuibacter physcomitrellae]GGI36730.1 hypothetical protein GCM10010988_10410 [Cnuibacter physcomitrellae]